MTARLENTSVDNDYKQYSPAYFCCQRCELHQQPGSSLFSVLSVDAANNTCRELQMHNQEEIT